jgi:hypothetical protein
LIQEATMLRLIPVLAACALCQAAAAQAVYKCSVDGKVSYGDQPCASGQSVRLPVPPAPAPQPAHEQADRARASSLQLEKLRLTRELAEQREQARAARVFAAQRQKCKRLALQHKWAGEDLARATGARVEAARIKARRQAEALAVQCPA